MLCLIKDILEFYDPKCRYHSQEPKTVPYSNQIIPVNILLRYITLKFTVLLCFHLLLCLPSGLFLHTFRPKPGAHV